MMNYLFKQEIITMSHKKYMLTVKLLKLNCITHKTLRENEPCKDACTGPLGLYFICNIFSTHFLEFPP